MNKVIKLLRERRDQKRCLPTHQGYTRSLPSMAAALRSWHTHRVSLSTDKSSCRDCPPIAIYQVEFYLGMQLAGELHKLCGIVTLRCNSNPEGTRAEGP